MKKNNPLVNILGTIGKDLKKILVVIAYLFFALLIIIIGFGVFAIKNSAPLIDWRSTRSGTDFSPINMSFTIIAIASVIFYFIYRKRGKSNRVKKILKKVLEFGAIALFLYIVFKVYSHYNSPKDKVEYNIETTLY